MISNTITLKLEFPQLNPTQAQNNLLNNDTKFKAALTLDAILKNHKIDREI